MRTLAGVALIAAWACSAPASQLDAAVASASDSGVVDAVPSDGPRDARPADDPPDAGLSDAGLSDAGLPDARLPDASPVCMPADAATGQMTSCPPAAAEAACLEPLATGFAGGTVTTDAVIEWTAVAADSDSIYVGGTTPGPDGAWRVEKRRLSDGALNGAFAVASNPTAGLDVLGFLLLDETGLYLIGAEDEVGTQALRWRIEKRSRATGALVTEFGVGGVVVLTGPFGSAPRGAVRDASSLYLSGFEKMDAVQTGLVLKLALTTGAPVGAFGVGGSVHDNSVTVASRLAVADGMLYLAGLSAGHDLVLQKRNAVTGALVPSFGSCGVVAYHAADRIPFKLLVTEDALYFLQYRNVAGFFDYGGRIDKLDRTTGVLRSEFGGCGQISFDPTTGGDAWNDILVIADQLYAVGTDATSGGRWRVERRNATTGVQDSSCITDPSSGSDFARAVILAGGKLFVVGAAAMGSSSAARIEVRTP